MSQLDLEAIKAQMQNTITSYPQPVVVSPNLLHPQLVLDLVAEIELLQELAKGTGFSKADTLADLSHWSVGIQMRHTAELEQMQDRFAAERVGLRGQLEEAQAEIKQLKADLAKAGKPAAKKTKT